MARFWNSLRFRLIFLVILGVVPPVGLIVHSGLEQRHLASIHARESVRLLAKEVARDYGLALDMTARMLGRLAKDPVIRSLDSSECSNRINIFLGTSPFPFYANIGVIGLNGDVLCSALKLSGPVNLADRLYFQEALKQGSISVGTFQVGRITGKSTINLGYPVLDEQGQVKAVVFAALDLSWFTRSLARMDLQEEMSVTLIDRKGTILHRRPDNEKWLGKPAADTEIVRTILEKGQGVTEGRGIDGIRKYYGFQPLPGWSKAGYVYAGIPTEGVVSEASRSMIRNLSWLGLSAIIGLVAVWFLAYVFIMRQFNTLVTASQEVAEGNLAARTGFDQTLGEIGEVGSAFDKMAETVQHREAELLKSHDELRREKALLDMILDGIPGIFYLFDSQGRFLRWNQNFERRAGYPGHEIALMHPLDFLETEDRKRTQEAIQATFERGAGAVEARFLSKDGTKFWNFFTGRRIEIAGKACLVGMGIDISRRKEMETSLRESEQMFRLLSEQSLMSVAILQDGVYKYANQAMSDLCEYSPEQIENWRSEEFLSVVHPADRSFVLAQARMKQKGDDRSQTHYAFRIITQSGTTKWVEIYSKTIQFRGSPANLITMLDITERKSAEEALQRSQAMLRSILNSVPQSIFWKDLNSVYLGCNEVFARAVGLGSTDEIVGKTDYDLPWPKNEADAYRADDQEVMTRHEAKPHIVEPLQQADGARLWIDTTKIPLTSDDGSVYGVLGVYEDITERKRTEEEKRLYAERLAALVQLGQMIESPLHELAAFAMEEAVRLTQSTIGYVAFASEDESILTMHAWSEEAMRQCAIEKKPLIYPVVSTGLWGEAVRQRRPVITNDYKMPNPWTKGTPEGHVEVLRHMNVPILDQGRIVAVAGVGNKPSDYEDNDVTQLSLLMEGMWGIVRRREAEQRLRRLGAAVESAGETIVITDSAGSIIYVNPAFEEITGYSRQEVYGQNPRILQSGEHDRAFYREMWDTLLAGHAWRGRFVNRKKDGTFYEETATISPIKNESGRISNYVAVKRDITVETLLQKQLFHAQKMEAIGTLAGGIAHDINNLLQAVLGYSDLLLVRKALADPDRKKLEIIQQAARDGADLVSRILTFSRKGESKTRPIVLNDEIRKSQELLRRTLPKMIQIDLLLADDIAIIDADPTQLEQVILNLGVNAQHAMPNGGRLLIETRNIPLRDNYLRTQLGAKAGEYVLLTVSDTGFGMEAEVLDRIFEPFFTTKTNGLGTGLGLAMVHGIVLQHGGIIKCYSEPGVGTSFKIYFPVSSGAKSASVTSTREMPALGTETVLLVDDDERVREMGKEMIEMGGYSVLVAKSGEDALEVYSLHKEEIALVVLDLIMPGMGGKGCLEELLRINPEVRVLVASGYSSDGFANGLEGSGAKGYVSKPYDAKDILSAIRRVLDEGQL